MLGHISVENYDEFFELFGDIYCILAKEYAEHKKGGEFSHRTFDLIYSSLIPRTVELMKESCDL